MNKPLAALALALSPLVAEAGMPKDLRPDRIQDHATTMHINTILHENGEETRQVMIQERDKDGQINVHGWRFLRGGERARYNHVTKQYELLFHDCTHSVERMVTSDYYMSSAQWQTEDVSNDPEVLNKKIFPEEKRRDFKSPY